jgi:gentisate 1,2-dioxygenase
MRRFILFALLTMVTLNATAGTKDKGTTVLKDVQPAGTTDKKHKHQQYDLSFATQSGKDYTCRTGEKTSVKATDLAVGSSVTYEVNSNKGKVKTSAGKQLDCTIVRVVNVPAATK